MLPGDCAVYKKNVLTIDHYLMDTNDVPCRDSALKAEMDFQ